MPPTLQDKLTRKEYAGLEQRLALMVAQFMTFTGDCANMSQKGWDGAYDLKRRGNELLQEFDTKHP